MSPPCSRRSSRSDDLQSAAQPAERARHVAEGWSPGPHTAFGRTGGGVRSRLSVRTWTPKRTVAAPSLLARIAKHSMGSTSHSRLTSSWQGGDDAGRTAGRLARTPGNGPGAAPCRAEDGPPARTSGGIPCRGNPRIGLAPFRIPGNILLAHAQSLGPARGQPPDAPRGPGLAPLPASGQAGAYTSRQHPPPRSCADLLTGPVAAPHAIAPFPSFAGPSRGSIRGARE
jgi:hypothetical protein